MRTLYIIRGLPGSGKSTLGAQLAPGARFEADDFFMHSGEYVFEPERLPEAHEDCRCRVENAMRRGLKEIAVCNVFARVEHAMPYVLLAQRHGYTINVIECQTNYGTVHPVPASTIFRLRRDWEQWPSGYDCTREDCPSCGK